MFPFPNVNDTAMMKLSFNIIRVVCWLVVILLPLAIAFFVPRCETVAGGILAAILLLGIVPASGQFLMAVIKEHAGKKK